MKIVISLKFQSIKYLNSENFIIIQKAPFFIMFHVSMIDKDMKLYICFFTLSIEDIGDTNSLNFPFS